MAIKSNIFTTAIVSLFKLEKKRKIESVIHKYLKNISPIFCPRGVLLSTASQDQRIALISSNLELLGHFNGHKGGVWCLAKLGNRALIASGSEDKSIKIWCIPRQILLLTLSGHTAAVRCLLYKSSGNILVSAGREGNVMLWDMENMSLIITLHSPLSTNYVSSSNNIFHYCPADEILIKGGENQNELIIWDLKTEKCRIARNLEQITLLDKQENGDMLLVSPGYIKISKLSIVNIGISPRDEGSKILLKGNCHAILELGNGNLVIGYGNGLIQIINLEGKMQGEMKYHKNLITKIIQITDRLIITCSFDKCLMAFDIIQYKCKAIFDYIHSDYIYDIAKFN